MAQPDPPTAPVSRRSSRTAARGERRVPRAALVVIVACLAVGGAGTAYLMVSPGGGSTPVAVVTASPSAAPVTSAASTPAQASVVTVTTVSATPTADGDDGTAAYLIGPAGRCVDVSGDDDGGDGAAVQLWQCQGDSTDQHWAWDGVQLVTLGRCLDVSGGVADAGTALQLADCNGGVWQAWTARSDHSLYNQASGRCAATADGATGDGSRLVLADCTGAEGQVFTGGGVTEVATGGPSGAARYTTGSWCIDVSGDDDGGAGAAVDLWTCQDGAADQSWTWQGTTLRTLGRCLAPAGPVASAGAELQLSDCDGGVWQDWSLRSDGTLYLPVARRCAAPADADAEDGARLVLVDCGTTDHQTWTRS